MKNESKNLNHSDFLVFFLGIVLIGILLQILGKAKGNDLVFPSVIEIFRAFIRLLVTKQTYKCIFVSIFHLALSLFFSTVIGVLIGVVSGLFPFVKKLLSPLMTMLRSIPMIVLVVIIMVLTQYPYIPYIATSVLLIPLISEATCEGFLHIDQELIDVYRLVSNFSPKILIYVYLPLMTGYLKQAYINAVGMGMKLVISSEYLVQTKNSLGKAIYLSSYFNEYQDIYAYALVMIFLVALLTKIPMWVIKKSGTW